MDKLLLCATVAVSWTWAVGCEGGPTTGQGDDASHLAGFGGGAGQGGDPDQPPGQHVAGQSGMDADGAIGGSAGTGAMGDDEPSSGAPDQGEMPGTDAGNGTAPPISDYAAPGPFGDAEMIANVGPGNNYTLFRPMASLGRDGFKHPIAAWGNGISTTPNQYQSTLTLLATHGFVIAACNDTQAERPCLSGGLDWLVAQNEAPGDLQGKLDTSSEITVGYSWGGGAAIDTADRPNVKATVSLYGMPPRGDTAFDDMHAPLLLFTSTGDTFVTAAEYVTPNYEASQVQTFYATRNAPEGHLYPIDEGAISCVASAFLSGPCGSAMAERAPMIAWLRLWAYGDQDARRFFYGQDCTLCQSPWSAQRKHWPE